MLRSKITEFGLGFGGAAISGHGGAYGFGPISDEESQDLLLYSYSQGVRLFDTAPIYGFGLSEQRMGSCFQGIREQVFLVSKCGVSWHENKRVNMSNDPSLCLKMLDQTLKDLKTEYLDLYMVHWPDPKVDIRRTMEALESQKQMGKILQLGLCNTSIEEILLAEEVAEVSWIQAEYSAFQKQNENLFRYAKESKKKTMAWGCLDKGILSGRVTRDRKFEKSDCRSWAPWWKSQTKEPKYLAMEMVSEWLKETDLSLLDLAVQFVKQSGLVDFILCGSRDQAQWDSMLNSYNKQIEPKYLDRYHTSIAPYIESYRA